jgi:OFA family oxalate/formate antiporter-like MFS transporter
LLYAGLGVIGGIGLGLGYVAPVATAAKWFPDKKGFITGMVVMGFGFGALFMSKLTGPFFIDLCTATGTTDWSNVFYLIAFSIGIPGIVAAIYMQNPHKGYCPKGWAAPATGTEEGAEQSLAPRDCIMSGRFMLMFFIFFCNITAGIMFIGFQSPLLQDMLKLQNPASTPAELAAAGATLIGISSLFNGIGRLFWGGLSDRIGRIQAFRLILGSQVFLFIALIFVKSPLLFGTIVCYILLCYGGGFGTMPSFVLTVFGNRVMAVVYGCILVAWSMAGLAGPQIVAFLKDSYSSQQAATGTFITGAVVLSIGFLASLALSNKAFETNNSG